MGFPPFKWDFGNLTAYCEKTYGVKPNVGQMQEWFPLDLDKSSSRIIFSNGLLDPWHGGGYLTPPGGNKKLPTVVIPSGAHHLDLRGQNEKDPIDVKRARVQEVAILEGW